MKKVSKDNPLKVVTLFSGYDSQCMALDRAGIPFDLLGWSEIDEKAIQAHNLCYPEYADRNLGDVTKINWWVFEDDVDLLTYSSPCFVAGTLVLTKNGYKPIEKLGYKDEVYTHDGSLKKVVAIGSDGVKPIFRLSAMGILDIDCTYNHPFLIRTRSKVWDNDIRSYRYLFSKPEKKRVYELESGCDYIGIPIIKDSSVLNLPDNLLWLAGRYVADGHCSNSSVILSIGKDKVESVKERCDGNYKVYEHSKSCCRIVFNKHTELYGLVQSGIFGCGAINKTIPFEILSLSKDKLKIFLDGYMSGDGSYVENSLCYQATTISKSLANSLVLAVQKVYGVGCKLYFTERPTTCIIENRVVNQHSTYMVRWMLEGSKKSWYNDGEYIWYPIRSIVNLGKSEKIYNITVEDNHTYMAENAMCFNCQDFSSAGLQRGGEEGSGTRSSLLWEVRRAVTILKPKYLLMENVKNLVGKKFRPLFDKWIEELESYGYKNFWKVMNAKDYGVPQNRERVFVVSILRTEDEPEPQFEFPEPFPLGTRLKDLLEPEVDEKYFLSEKAEKYFMEHAEIIYDLEDDS